MSEDLPHTDEIRALLRAGRRTEAIRLHNARVKGALRQAHAGGIVNLSDLMAAREQLEEYDAQIRNRNRGARGAGRAGRARTGAGNDRVRR